MKEAHSLPAPSPWITRFAPLVAPGSTVLDLACGTGRHARLFAQQGCQVDAVDRDAEALAELASVANIRTRLMDLETGNWPLGVAAYDAVVVTNYLHRALFDDLIASLNASGVLLYETFMLGNEQFGRPARPEFLLRPDELLELVKDQLQVIAFEQGYAAQPKPAMVQRLAAVRPGFPRPRAV
jgi:SAM-dependent methyltransferase